VVANLRPGGEYQLQVLAENEIGVSDPCTLPASVKMPAAPSARMLNAFSSINHSITLQLAQVFKATTRFANSKRIAGTEKRFSLMSERVDI